MVIHLSFSSAKKVFYLTCTIFFLHSIISCGSGRVVSCVYDPVNPNVRNFTNLKEKKVTSLNIANGMFKGLLEYTPKGYDATDTATKYPLIVYFHGVQARGQGTENDLCKILWDGITGPGASLPPLIESNDFPAAFEVDGKKYSFIVISPQFTVYEYPKEYPSVKDVDAVLDYVLTHYRVDPSRIYLTGMSTGANMVIEYAASGNRRHRIAAVGIASLCARITNKEYPELNISPENIAAAKLPIWFIHCKEDRSCSVNITQDWVDAITVAGGVAPRFTILSDENPDDNFRCASFTHNTWVRLYDPDFRVEGTNLYEWFLKQTSEPASP